MPSEVLTALQLELETINIPTKFKRYGGETIADIGGVYENLGLPCGCEICCNGELLYVIDHDKRAPLIFFEAELVDPTSIHRLLEWIRKHDPRTW